MAALYDLEAGGNDRLIRKGQDMFDVEPAPYPPTIVYGTEMPDLRLRFHGSTQQYFCRHNSNLHLTDADFHFGTYEMGSLLEQLCTKHCWPTRQPNVQPPHGPCPAFVKSWKWGKEKPHTGLATVEMRPVPEWEECAGVKALLDICETQDERFFLKAYLDDKFSDEHRWRDSLVTEWNANWHLIENGWGRGTRTAKFDSLIWRTLRFPALIPQFWLNWLYSASEEEQQRLEENPSRVDFIAFWNGERHVVEIDGPSHYAAYVPSTGEYVIDEREYARNLKIARSLQRAGWVLTRIGRSEVREFKDDPDAGWLGYMDLLKALPFYANEGYPDEYSLGAMGIDVQRQFTPAADFGAGADDDIPF